MITIEKLIARVRQTQHGFLDIQHAADEVVDSHTARSSLALARELYATDICQARCLAAFILGRLAAFSPDSLNFLKAQVSQDASWQVQEILAKAFDRYCADSGYERVLPVIYEWLADPQPNVRRAVTEGLRIWTSRPYFREHPDAAVRCLSALRADDSEYVRKSVGNALRDISRKHQDLVRVELQHWDTSKKSVQQTYRLASKFL